jgi:uncharacterized Ntn-hydrolase superfamily protein
MKEVTYSIVAWDAENGDLGVAVQSKFLATGAVVPHASAGVGAIATQALANTSYGWRGLRLLARGATPSSALAELVARDPLSERRQAAIVDAAGEVASHTGRGCMPWAGGVQGHGFACIGNVLVSEATVEAMAHAMELNAPLPERLVAALDAGQAAGGDSRGQQSAALLVVRTGGGYGGLSDRMIDLRVDDHRAPISELRRLLQLHRRHFERPRDEELTPLEGALASEVAVRLSKIFGIDVAREDLDELWETLGRWAGRENLEERMVKRRHVDPVILEALREVEN